MALSCLTVALHQLEEDDVPEVIGPMQLMGQILAATILLALVNRVAGSCWAEAFPHFELRA